MDDPLGGLNLSDEEDDKPKRTNPEIVKSKHDAAPKPNRSKFMEDLLGTKPSKTEPQNSQTKNEPVDKQNSTTFGGSRGKSSFTSELFGKKSAETVKEKPEFVLDDKNKNLTSTTISQQLTTTIKPDSVGNSTAPKVDENIR